MDGEEPEEEKSITDLLPLHLFHAIIVRLPAKHIGRLKLVSKLWLSLISDPSFVEFHIHHSSAFTTPSYFFTQKYELVESLDLHALFHGGATLPASIEEFSLPSPKKKKNELSRLLVLGSCRGFVLLHHYQPYYIVLWNPLTQSHKRISYYNVVKAKNCWNHDYYRHYAVLQGVGYDSSRDDYLIVIAFKENQFHCFSLRTNTWTKIEVAPPIPLITGAFIPAGLFFNGVIHWLCHEFNNQGILIFDVKKRIFSKIPLPEQKPTWRSSELVILGGCLALNFLNYSENSDNERTQIWVMKEYKVQSSWILLCEIRHRCIRSLFLSNSSDFIVVDSDKNFAKYNIEGERLQCFRSFGYHFFHFPFVYTLYTPSLATLPSCDKKKWKTVRYSGEFFRRIFSHLARMIGITKRSKKERE